MPTRRQKTVGPKTVAVPGLPGVKLRISGAPPEPRLELRDQLKMPREVFGRMVNVSPRSIAGVEISGRKVAKLQRPYREISRLYAALREVVDPACIADWFIAPNDAFNGLKPIEVIERGEIDRLWDMVYRLRSGEPG